MNHTFIQKKLFSSKEFILTEKELQITTKSLKENKSFSIPLDTIGQRIYYHSNPPLLKNLIAGICFLIPLFMTYGYFFAENPMDKRTYLANIIIWTPLCLIVFLAKGKKDVHIIGGQNTISFYQDLPDKEKLNNFISLICEKSKNFIYEKYAKIDTDLPESQQMQTFHWLLTQEIISEQEYNQLKDEYKTKKLI